MIFAAKRIAKIFATGGAARSRIRNAAPAAAMAAEESAVAIGRRTVLLWRNVGRRPNQCELTYARIPVNTTYLLTDLRASKKDQLRAQTELPEQQVEL